MSHGAIPPGRRVIRPDSTSGRSLTGTPVHLAELFDPVNNFGFIDDNEMQIARVMTDHHPTNPAFQPHLRLDALPLELLGKICGHLAPLWIRNLSLASPALYHRLNGPEANYIWYDALPHALLRKEERFQSLNETFAWSQQVWDRKQAVLDSLAREARVLEPATATGRVEEIFEDDPTHSVPAENDEPVDAEALDSAVAVAVAAAAASVPAASVQAAGDVAAANTSSSKHVHSTLHSTAQPDDGSEENLGSQSEHQLESVPGNQGFITIGSRVYDVARLLRYARYYMQYAPSVAPPLTCARVRGGNVVLALGGPYEPLLNYKREILGRLWSDHCCYICLIKEHRSRQIAPLIAAWGIRFCGRCFDEIIVEDADARPIAARMSINIGVSSDMVLDDYRNRTMTFRNDRYIFVSDLTERLRKLGHLSWPHFVHDHHVSRAKLRHQLAGGNHGGHYHLRAAIVSAAESIWDGLDPNPRAFLDQEGNLTVTVSPDFHPARYAVFRRRFMPTRLLKHCLFPQDLLLPTNHPSVTWSDAALTFPADPVQQMTDLEISYRLTELDWITRRAQEMVDTLAEWRVRSYDTHEFSGGRCDIWCRAAHEYQVARLKATVEERFAEGNLHTLDARTARMSHSIWERLYFERTMFRLGRGPFNIADVHGPLRPAEISGPEALDIPRESLKVEVHQELVDKCERAKAILFATCKRCPVNNLLVLEKGLEGTVRHMRANHAALFWESDDWELPG